MQLLNLAIALALGLIVGLERGWTTRDQHGGERAAGFRSFGLAGLTGGIVGLLSSPDRVIVIAAGVLAFGALVVTAYVVSARATKDRGMTTEIALMATFGLGVMATLGAPFEAAAAAIVMSLLLGLKPELHRAVRGLERRELLATLQLLLIAAVLVPLLPARDMGPWQAINPRTIGLLVLLIAGLSYIGYFAVALLGSRIGLILTAALGGLSSSTAVTVAYARRARAIAAEGPLLGAGIALAAATMVPRLAIEIAAVNADILAGLWPTFVALAAIPLIGLAWVALSSRKAVPATEIKLANPLQLKAALVFGALLSVLSLASAALQDWLGDPGVYAVAAIAGLADVDAIGLSLAQAAGRTISEETAQRAIVLAVLVNTATKAGIATVLGGYPMLRWAGGTLIAALAVAALTAALTL